MHNRLRIQLTKLFSVFLSLALICLSLPPAATLYLLAPAQAQSQAAETKANTAPESKHDFEFTLEETTAPLPQAASPNSTRIQGTALSPIKTEEILKRLKVLEPISEEKFVLPEDSLIKPKLPGTESIENFPPKNAGVEIQKPDLTKAKPEALKVTNVSHTGNVEEIKHLTIGFSQPMIPLAKVDSISPAQFITLNPLPKGTWKWAGPQTAIFEPSADRFPNSTKYSITIPANIASVTGNQLEKTVSWEITTPTVRAEKLSLYWPQYPILCRKPVIVAHFNQAVETKNLAKFIRLEVNEKLYLAKVLNEGDLQARNKLLKEPIKIEEHQKNIAFETLEELPPDQNATVNFDKGISSAEGPLKSVFPSTLYFHIHGPLAIRLEREKPLAGDDCAVHFNSSNPLASKSLTLERIKVNPQIENLKLSTNGKEGQISGVFKPFTTYRVKFAKEITDDYGQTLGKDIELSFQTSQLSPSIQQDFSLKTIPPWLPAHHQLWLQGAPKAEVSIYKVQPSDWPKYCQWPRKEVGSLLAKRVYNIGLQGTMVDLDLKPYLNNGTGQLVIETRLVAKTLPNETKTSCWIQVTGIGLDAYNGQNLQVLATSLKDCKPLKDISIEFYPHHETKLSNVKGFATFSLPSSPRQGTDILIARKDKDVCMLPASEYGGAWFRQELEARRACWAVSDRNIYRPQEVAQIKGWFRPLSYEENGAIKLSYPGETIANYCVLDGQNNLIEEGSTTIDSHGGFNFNLTIPKKITLGQASIYIKPASTALTVQRAKSTDGHSHGSSESAPRSTFEKLNSLMVDSHVLYIEIQEFRKPEFEMKVKSSAGQSLTLGEDTILTSSSTYLSGGTLNNAPIQWEVQSSKAHYAPPNWQEYQFTPPACFANEFTKYQLANHTYKTLTGTTGADGKHSIKLSSKKHQTPIPLSYKCQATVTDVNRQQWSNSTTILMHPSDLYVGIKSDKWYYTADEPMVIDLVVSDLDGKIKEDTQIDLEIATLLSDNQTKVSKSRIVMGKAPIELKLPGNNSAQKHTITATIHDSKDRINATEINLSVFKTSKVNADKKSTEQTLLLNANAKEYQPNDTAEITISTPFFPAQGQLFLVRNKIVSTLPLRLEGPKTTVKLPITQAYYPKLQAKAYLIGENGNFGSGSIILNVPPKQRLLKLSTYPEKEQVIPGKETTIALELHDSSGKPVAGGQIALAVVDEAVLALSNYNWQDPMATFYPEGLGTLNSRHSRSDVLQREGNKADLKEDQAWDIRSSIFFRNPEAKQFFNAARSEEPRDLNLFQVEPGCVDERHYSSGQAERHSRGNQAPINLRENFSALASFNAAVKTDDQGKACVTFKLPDNITRYRIMAAAVADTDKFGSCESSINARLPLAIKPSPPRFLNLTDECQLPLVLHNQTDKPLEAEVVLRANGVTLSTAGKAVTIPANDRVEVDMPVQASRPGMAHFQCAVVANESSDAAEFSIPVLTPASSETFTAYGSLDLPKERQPLQTSNQEIYALQKIETPADVYGKLGGLTLTTSSTALQSLTDAYFYLRDYGYNCSEQLSSRLIAMLSLQDTLISFGLIKADELEHFKSTIQSDIETLEKRQTQYGGFGLWSASDQKSWPYVGVQVTRALVLAKNKDYKVNATVLTNALTYLKTIENFIPPEFSQTARFAIVARAINVRHLAGDSDSRAANWLLERARENQTRLSSTRKDSPWLSIETAAWLLPILAKDKNFSKETEQLRLFINRQIRETASTATANDEQSPYGNWGYCLFNSARRTDAAILEALLEDQPENPVIPKLAKGLLAHRKNGVWEGTQENAYILQALDKYFHAYEKSTPDFSLRAWLDDTLMANQKFAGRSTESKTVKVPMQYLQDHHPREILIGKTGPGRLYYRLALNYVPKSFQLPPLEQGFKITRTYEAIDSGDDVTRDKDGIWHFKAGANIKVKIHFEVPGSRYHVALADPLPAGAEIINTALVGTRQMLPPRPSRTGSNCFEPGNLHFESDYRDWWQRQWYEHQNLRDHQAEAFSSLLYAGAYDYSYIIQATTPGSFIIPPCKIEEMYMSETFGRTASEKVVIE